MTRKIFPVILALFMTGLASQTSTVNAFTIQELVSLADQIQNGKPGIRFEIRADKSVYQVGDPVVFSFKADKDCYLVLLDIGTSGRTVILFPNRWHPDNRIEKDKTYRIPPVGSEYGYRVEGPAGVERVKAIASLEPTLSQIGSLQNELRPPTQAPPVNVQAVAQVFVTIRDPGTVLKDIGLEFSKIDPAKWATATLTFSVAGSGASFSPGKAAMANASATTSDSTGRIQ